MGTFRSSSRTALAIGAESAVNTPGTSGHLMPKSSVSIPGLLETITSDELQSDPNPTLDAEGIYTGTGFQVVNPLSCDFFGLMCYWFFGDYAVSGVGDPYTHTFKINSTNPSSLFLEVGDTGVSKYDLFKGLMISSLQLGGQKTSDLLRATWALAGTGLSTINGAAPVDAAADEYGDARHVLPIMEARVGGAATTYLTGIDLTISRPVVPQMVLDGNRYGSDVDLGKYTVDCMLTGWRDAADTLFGLADGTDKSVSLYSEDPDDATHSIEIFFNESRVLNTEGYQISGGDGPYESQVKVSPYKDDHADASGIKIVVINGIEDYAVLGAAS